MKTLAADHDTNTWIPLEGLLQMPACRQLCVLAFTNSQQMPTSASDACQGRPHRHSQAQCPGNMAGLFFLSPDLHLTACRISVPQSGLNLGPGSESMQSQPLDHPKLTIPVLQLP